MYKVLLCLRYLKSRALAYFAVVGVALCVAMMLIVVSVMNGFVDKIERAAKGLFGDVIVQTGSLRGLGRYDEFAERVVREVPEVEAASPFILTYGILQVGPDYQVTIQVAGIRLPGRAGVSDFEDGLFYQAGTAEPSFDPPFEWLGELLAADRAHIEAILQRVEGADEPTTADRTRLVERLKLARDYHTRGGLILRRAQPYQRELREVSTKLNAALARSGGQETEQTRQLGEQLEQLIDKAGVFGPDFRVILGQGIPGLSFRTPRGEIVRILVPGDQVVLSLLPLGQKLSAREITPIKEAFTIVDDCTTDVSSIDTEIVYVPFETLQRLNRLEAIYSADDPTTVAVPARCSQLHLKVRPEFAEGAALQQVRRKVDEAWSRFEKDYPDAVAPGDSVSVLTWRQRQAKLVNQIESQRTLMVIMMGIISMVAVLLIFVIFYMLVYQKTRDIGVLKAVGASSGGVAGIFLGYGAAIGLVGSILGTVGGYFFVRYINPIHDAMGRWFGFQVWDREWFMFEKIPNEVGTWTAVTIVIGAICAGLIGAIIPAVRAARMQPVEALRYE